MKRMCRVIALVLLLVILLGITVQADVIWEPENLFYQAHRKDCMPYNRTHYINASDGSLDVYTEPNGKKVLATLLNGTEEQISYTYDNKTWGLVSCFDSNGGKWVTGWIDMKETVLKYDYLAFVEEHSDQFYDDTDYISRTMLKDFEREDTVYIYSYPGVESTDRREIKASYVVGYHYKFQSLFKDKNGRIWVVWGSPSRVEVGCV